MTPKRTTRSTPTTTTTTTPVTSAQLKALIDQGVVDALATRDADRSMNGDDNHNSGTGVRSIERVSRECTYPDFMKCQPLNFKGTEGVVELTQWFEKMKTVFRISNCSMENQIKSEKKMTNKYCPRSEIKKLEVEMWNLKVKDKIERYVGGLPDMIHRSVVASKPKTMQEAIEMATKLIDKKIYPSQVSPPRTPGSNEYVPLAGVPSKNTWAFTCSYQFNPLKLIRKLRCSTSSAILLF
ncbi:hypothetical protein Tco_0545944 [Tanacetum coccineum]